MRLFSQVLLKQVYNLIDFVSNNIAVSRSHADIITRGQRYYVIDLNSKNKTYINGQPLPIQQECEIFNGNQLRLANEEFVFYTWKQLTQGAHDEV